jgi:hypothetical protein
MIYVRHITALLAGAIMGYLAYHADWTGALLVLLLATLSAVQNAHIKLLTEQLNNRSQIP